MKEGIWFKIDTIEKNNQTFMLIPTDAFRPMLIVVDHNAAEAGYDAYWATPIKNTTELEIYAAQNEYNGGPDITTWVID